jgi:hypothetical protein
MMNCPLNIYLLCQFAMGLNMPAKTVVFTAVKKWDGDSHRYIGSGEYIQVSDNLLHFSRALKNICTHKCLCIYVCVCVCVCVYYY